MSSAIVKTSETHIIETDPLAEPPVRPRFQRTLMRCSPTGRRRLKEERELREDHAAARMFVNDTSTSTSSGMDVVQYTLLRTPDGAPSTARQEKRDRITAQYLSRHLKGKRPKVASKFLGSIYGLDCDKGSAWLSGEGRNFVECMKVCLEAGASPEYYEFSRIAACRNEKNILDLLLEHGANKEQALVGAAGGHPDLVDSLLDRGAIATEEALAKAVEEGETRIVRALLDHDAPVNDDMIRKAETEEFSDIATMLRDAQESRRTLTFTAAVTQEAEGNADVLIKSKNGALYIDINDCTMHGSKSDLQSFIQYQREVFRLTDAFSAWNKPRPAEDTEKVTRVIGEAHTQLDGRLAVYHNDVEVEGYLPFVRAHFDRAARRMDYLYLLPDDLNGVPREEMRWVKEAKQEATEAADADLGLLRKFKDAGIVDDPLRTRIATGVRVNAIGENTHISTAEADTGLLQPPSSARLGLTPGVS